MEIYSEKKSSELKTHNDVTLVFNDYRDLKKHSFEAILMCSDALKII